MMPLLHALWAGIARLSRRAAARLAEHRRYQATLAELRRMDQRQLDDLGIAPRDFRRIASHR